MVLQGGGGEGGGRKSMTRERASCCWRSLATIDPSKTPQPLAWVVHALRLIVLLRSDVNSEMRSKTRKCLSAFPKRGRSKRGRLQMHANERKRAQMSTKSASARA